MARQQLFHPANRWLSLNPQWRSELTQDVLDKLVTFGQRFLRDPSCLNGPVYQTEMEDYFEGEMKNEEGFATENQVRYTPNPFAQLLPRASTGADALGLGSIHSKY